MKEGWKYKKLGEVGDIITGSTPSTKEEDNYNSSDVCFVKPSDIPKQGIGFLSETEFYISRKAYNNSRKLPKGSVLTTCIGIIGKVGILNVDATCNQQINAIIPHSNISSTFLAYSILSKRHYLEHISNAPVVPIINKKEFSNTTIPIPPLAEQERIVAELDLLNSIIDKKKAQLKELDQLAQSIFYDMFGDPITNEKGWEVRKLGEMCYVITKGTTPTTLGFSFIEEGINFVKVESFINGRIDSSKLSHISQECHLTLSRSELKDEDLLICIAGATIGKMAVVDSSILPANTNQACAIIRLKDNKIIKFIQSYLELKFEHDVMQMGKGVAQPNLSLGQLRNLPIPLPPLPLQQEFASKIESIERQKSLIQQSIVETQTLFDSRMDYWFG